MKPSKEFLNTAELRGLTYGTLVWREEQHKFSAIGVAGSLAMFLLLFGIYLVCARLDAKGEERRLIQISSGQVEMLPPPIEPAVAAAAPPQKPKAREDAGEIQKVSVTRRARQNEDTPRIESFAAQEELKSAMGKGGTGDSTASNAALNIDGAIGNGESENETAFDFAEVQPAFINHVAPIYPEMAKRAGIEGKLVLRVLVGADGKPLKAEIIKRATTEIFDEVAIQSAMNSTYAAARQNGKFVKCWLTVPIAFKLR